MSGDRARRAVAPPPTGDRELDAVVASLFDLGAVVVSIGHGRDPRSVEAARRVAERWRGVGRVEEGEAFARDVDTVVDWPPSAASWLRPALRLAAGGADAWVIADTPEGFAPVARRLRRSTSWAPSRTVCCSGLADPRLAELLGPDASEGLRGVDGEGRRWQIVAGAMTWADGGPAEGAPPPG